MGFSTTCFLIPVLVAIPTLLAAQGSQACSPNTRTVSDLRVCVDLLLARQASDSVSRARYEADVDSLLAVNRQLQLAIADINRRLPATGKSAADTTGKVVINGDLIVSGRLCIPDACIGDAGEQIQIRGAKGAGILFQSNRDGTWVQSACAGMSSLSMSPDLGLRLVQNQRWTSAGTHVNFICPNNATGAVGFDSQAEWSFNGQKPGKPELGTQRLVIRTDEDAKTVYFATWAEGWKVEFRSSADGCKWCENIRWKVPYQ